MSELRGQGLRGDRVSRINSRLGLKPAGKRAMMKLPPTRAEAAALTALKCPMCPFRWILDNVIHGRRMLMCARCNYSWYPDEASE